MRWLFLCFVPLLAITSFIAFGVPRDWVDFLFLLLFYTLFYSFTLFCFGVTVICLVGWFPRPGKTLGWLVTDLFKLALASPFIFNVFRAFVARDDNPQAYNSQYFTHSFVVAYRLLAGWGLFSILTMAGVIACSICVNVLVLVPNVVFRLGIVPLFWILGKAAEQLLKVMSRKGLVWILLVLALLALLVGSSLDLFCS